MNRKKLFSLKMDQETLDMLKQIAEDTMGGNMSLTLRRLVHRDYSARYRLTDAGRAAIEEAEKK
jgi:hypothetical protein